MGIEQFLDHNTFGKGQFLGDDPGILELTKEQRLLVSAHRHACPNPTATSENYGNEWTRKRYDECNFVFSSLICQMAKQNKELHEKLVKTRRRNPAEPVGNFEKGRVPDKHFDYISPLSNLTGYALPRIFIEIAGRGSERTQEKYIQALDILEKSIQVSETPAKLLARLSEEALNVGVSAETILSHTLAFGILREENNYTEADVIANDLGKLAPKVWESYNSMSRNARVAHDIIPYLDC